MWNRCANRRTRVGIAIRSYRRTNQSIELCRIMSKRCLTVVAGAFLSRVLAIKFRKKSAALCRPVHREDRLQHRVFSSREYRARAREREREGGRERERGGGREKLTKYARCFPQEREERLSNRQRQRTRWLQVAVGKKRQVLHNV